MVARRPQDRWPAHIYGTGQEPDPRFSLANERTFLAYIRTALALLAGGAAVNTFNLGLGEFAQQVAATVLAGTGLLCAVQALRGWAANEKALRQRRPLPSPAVVVLITAGVALVAAVLVFATVL